MPIEATAAAEDARAEAGVEPSVAPAQSEVPPPPAAEAAPPSPVLSPSPPPVLQSGSAPAPFHQPTAETSLSSRLAALQTRALAAVPPRWIEVARRYPVLWLVVAPVFGALLLILVVAAFEPEPRAEATPARSATSTPAPAPAQPAAAATAAAAKDELDEAAVAALESKAAGSLSVQELLLLDQNRAQRKRADAKALSQKLRADPALAKEASVQSELLRFATDPDTAADALAAMARAPAPVGPDLLYEAWMSRSVTANTAELARALLYSREVRPGASPALAAALELRAAEGCEAVQAALPRAQADGDNRSIASLIKLTSRRGCGAKKRDDCYACLRSQTKLIIAATKAAKDRRAPSYPTP
jgi:hypothetical protein